MNLRKLVVEEVEWLRQQPRGIHIALLLFTSLAVLQPLGLHYFAIGVDPPFMVIIALVTYFTCLFALFVKYYPKD